MELFFFILLELWNMLQFITGCQVPKRTSIKVNFIEDVYGAIVVHTCCNTITLPRNVWREEEQYSALAKSMSVIFTHDESLNFNTA
jgi:hypothetical protein